jgi:hypothetical protein
LDTINVKAKDTIIQTINENTCINGFPQYDFVSVCMLYKTGICTRYIPKEYFPRVVRRDFTRELILSKSAQYSNMLVNV